MADFGDELFLDDVGDYREFDRLYFSESLEIEQDLAFPRHLLSSTGFDLGTLTPTPPGSAFSFDSDPDFHGHPTTGSYFSFDSDDPDFHGHLTPGSYFFFYSDDPDFHGHLTPGSLFSFGSDDPDFHGHVGVYVFVGFLDERVTEAMYSGNNDSIFSDESPIDFGDDGEVEELDDGILRWMLSPVLLDEDDDFEVFPGHLADDAPVGGAPPAARAVVERLQVVTVGEEEEEAARARGCAVCKDEITQGELATRLPCGHFYHAACIRPWLAIRNTCPVCRYELVTDDPEYERRRAKRRTAGGTTAQSLGTPMQM